MPQVPVLKPRDVIKVFKRFGWDVARSRGSHIILTKEGHIATLSVPNQNQYCFNGQPPKTITNTPLFVIILDLI